MKLRTKLEHFLTLGKKIDVNISLAFIYQSSSEYNAA